MKTIIIHRLVKSEDLNHHGTLFAGRCSEWFVEAGFIAASDLTNPENIVCLNIHGMKFLTPVNKGNIIRLESKVVLVGKTKIVVHIQIQNSESNTIVKGFITFIHVDKLGRPLAHRLKKITAVSEDELEIISQAEELHEKINKNIS